ncbi:MAG TPA: hypothetical protein ENM97_00465, partial [Moorella mulderi]|nr:hypothetical protein [Moorella mulderi]
MWDKAISRILGPIGLAVLAGAVLGTAAAPALRKEARKVAVQATKGILTLKEGAQRLAEEARSSWK